ncbi:MAG: hypothetical protein OXG11_02925, partial [Chloroflexi bacterium]|nr:hypothetical protein [Chloroflexota bacterium]
RAGRLMTYVVNENRCWCRAVIHAARCSSSRPPGHKGRRCTEWFGYYATPELAADKARSTGRKVVWCFNCCYRGDFGPPR